MSAGGLFAFVVRLHTGVCDTPVLRLRFHTHEDNLGRTRMNHGEFPENEPVPPEALVTSMMTAVAWLHGECNCEDEHHDNHPQPAMELRAQTLAGTEYSLLIPPVLAAPLLESVMRLMQVYVGEPGNSGSYEVPDTPDDIDWSQR